jgi:hypothetical protein
MAGRIGAKSKRAKEPACFRLYFETVKMPVPFFSQEAKSRGEELLCLGD